MCVTRPLIPCVTTHTTTNIFVCALTEIHYILEDTLTSGAPLNVAWILRGELPTLGISHVHKPAVEAERKKEF